MKKLQYSLIGLCTCIALFSCEKDKNNVSSNVGGDKNLVSAEIIDTFTVVTYNDLEDTIKTSEQSTPLVGAYNSDEVGLVNSALYVTLKPDSLGSSLPSSDFKVDSLFLTLDIASVYGSPINQEFDIYRLDKAVEKDSTYYAFNSMPYSELIGTISVNESDSGLYSFPLDTAFANKLVLADSTAMSSDDDFSSFFKGLAIVPKTGSLGSNEGAIYNLARTGIKMHLQYHSTLLNPTKTYDTEIVYEVESDNFIFTGTANNITGSELETVLNDSTLGQSMFYTQGLMGGIGKVNFPTLQSWYSDTNNYLINKFEFTVYVEDNSSFTLPTELMLTYKNDAGGTSFTTSVLNSTSNSYTFTISPSQLDTQLKTGTASDMDFTILVPFPGSNVNQVKIHGGSGINPPILKISYTKF